MGGIPLGHTSLLKAFSDFQERHDTNGYLQAPEPIGRKGTAKERKSQWDKWYHDLNRTASLSAQLFTGGLQDGHLIAKYKIVGEPESYVEPHLWSEGGQLYRSMHNTHTPLEDIFNPPDPVLPVNVVLYIADDELSAFTNFHFPKPPIPSYGTYPDNGPRIRFAQALSCLWTHIDEPLLELDYAAFVYNRFIPEMGSKGRLSVNATEARTGRRATITKDGWTGAFICPIEGDLHNSEGGIEFTDLYFHRDQIEALVPEHDIELAKAWLADGDAGRWQLSDEHEQWIADKANQPVPMPVLIPVDDELPAPSVHVAVKETTVGSSPDDDMQSHAALAEKKTLPEVMKTPTPAETAMQPDVEIKPVSNAEAERWYKAHVDEWLKIHPIVEDRKTVSPSRDDEAALAVGKFGFLENGQARLSRNRVIKLRSRFAPVEWTIGGRPTN